MEKYEPDRGAATYPRIFGPPAIQRKRDRYGELVDDDPPRAPSPHLEGETLAAARAYYLARSNPQYADAIRAAVDAALRDAASGQGGAA